MQGPLVEKLAEEVGDEAVVGKLNSDEHPEVAAQYGIRGIPTLLVFKGGKPVKGFVGVTSLPNMKAALQEASSQKENEMLGIGSVLKIFLGAGVSDPSANLDPLEAQKHLKDKNPPQLIDVRSREEHQEARIPGSRLIPLQELADRLKEIDKARPVLLYCRSGNRSGMAYQTLKSHGYPNVSHIQGGILAWSQCGLPVERGNT